MAEIPTIWLDRQLGESRFDIGRFVPSYLRWYFFAIGRRLTTEQLAARWAEKRYTYGGDLARGIVVAMEHEAAHDEDINLCTAESTTTLELAELIWREIKGPDVPFRYVSDEPFVHDVAKRVPHVSKARELLSFTATTTLDAMLDEVIPWTLRAIHDGRR